MGAFLAALPAIVKGAGGLAGLIGKHKRQAAEKNRRHKMSQGRIALLHGITRGLGLGDLPIEMQNAVTAAGEGEQGPGDLERIGSAFSGAADFLPVSPKAAVDGGQAAKAAASVGAGVTPGHVDPTEEDPYTD